MKEFRDKSRQVSYIDQRKANKMAVVSDLPDQASDGDEVYYDGNLYKRILGKWRLIGIVGEGDLEKGFVVLRQKDSDLDEQGKSNATDVRNLEVRNTRSEGQLEEAETRIQELSDRLDEITSGSDSGDSE